MSHRLHNLRTELSHEFWAGGPRYAGGMTGWPLKGLGPTASDVQRATSRKAREVAHPQLFRSTFQRPIPLYCLGNVAHPPVYRHRAVLRRIVAVIAAERENISVEDEANNVAIPVDQRAA